MDSNKELPLTTESKADVKIGMVVGAVVSIFPSFIFRLVFHDSPAFLDIFIFQLLIGVLLGSVIGGFLFWIKFIRAIRFIGSAMLGILVGLIVFNIIFYIL